LVAATATSGIVGPSPNDEIWTQNNPAALKDKSLFGEMYYTLFDHWNFTLGLRKYWLDQTADYTADGYMKFGPTPSAPQNNSQTGLDPKYSIAYKFDADTMVYATASKGFRAGGAKAELDFCVLSNLPLDAITHLKSDTLWTYEAGAKIQLPHPGLLVSLAGFHIDWQFAAASGVALRRLLRDQRRSRHG
jgi:outer membrane receptor protein involved in Fe transport